MIKVKARPAADDLPPGYQYGDARAETVACPICQRGGDCGWRRPLMLVQTQPFDAPHWRRPSDNAADLLARSLAIIERRDYGERS